MPSGNNVSIDGGSIVEIEDSCNKMASADIPSKDGLKGCSFTSETI
jgi:hypothetical protein